MGILLKPELIRFGILQLTFRLEKSFNGSLKAEHLYYLNNGKSIARFIYYKLLDTFRIIRVSFFEMHWQNVYLAT